MPNSNCLAGMYCPRCGSDGPFNISVRAFAKVYDDGVEDVWGVDWENDAPCDCYYCWHAGLVTDFLKEGNCDVQ